MFLCLLQYSSCACSLFWEVRSPAKAVTFCQQLQQGPWGKCFQTAPAMASCTCFHSSSPQTEVHVFGYFNAIIKSSSRAACRACMLDRDTEHVGGMLTILPPLCSVHISVLCWPYPHYRRGHIRARSVQYTSSYLFCAGCIGYKMLG